MAASACQPAAIRQTSGFDSSSWASCPFTGTDLVDTDGFHDPSTNPSRFTIPDPGLYMFLAAFTASAIGVKRESRLRVDGSDDLVYGYNTEFQTLSGLEHYGGKILQTLCLDEGQYVELQGQTNGSPDSIWWLTLFRINNGNGKVFVGHGDGASMGSGWNAVPWVADEDEDNMHSDSTNPSRINIPTAGLYAIGAQTVWDDVDFTADRQTQIRFSVNGTFVGGFATHWKELGDDAGPVSLTVLDLAANDYVEIEVNSVEGATRSLLNAQVTVFPVTGACSVRRSSDVTQGSNVAVPWNAELADSDAFHSLVANTDRVTIPSGKAGIYLWHAQPSATGGTFSGGNYLHKNDANITPIYQSWHNSGAWTSPNPRVLDLAVADYVQCGCFNSDGGNVTVKTDANACLIALDDFTYGPVRCGGPKDIIRY